MLARQRESSPLRTPAKFRLQQATRNSLSRTVAAVFIVAPGSRVAGPEAAGAVRLAGGVDGVPGRVSFAGRVLAGNVMEITGGCRPSGGAGWSAREGAGRWWRAMWSRSRWISSCWAASRDRAWRRKPVSSAIRVSFSARRRVRVSLPSLRRLIWTSRGSGLLPVPRERGQAAVEFVGEVLVGAGPAVFGVEPGAGDAGRGGEGLDVAPAAGRDLPAQQPVHRGPDVLLGAGAGSRWSGVPCWPSGSR